MALKYYRVISWPRLETVFCTVLTDERTTLHDICHTVVVLLNSDDSEFPNIEYNDIMGCENTTQAEAETWDAFGAIPLFDLSHLTKQNYNSSKHNFFDLGKPAPIAKDRKWR